MVELHNHVDFHGCARGREDWKPFGTGAETVRCPLHISTATLHDNVGLRGRSDTGTCMATYGGSCLVHEGPWR